MKQHLKLKLAREATVTKIPYWQDIIHDKPMAQISIEPEIDRILSKFNLPVWQTREYKPALKTWDTTEINSGLNRIYRLILQRNTSIPPLLIAEISLLPIVEEVSIARIGQSDLPSMEVMQMSLNTDRRSRQAIYLHKAHQFSQGDPRIIVAVLDTGLDLDHSEYKDNLLPGYDFVNIIDGANQFVGDYLDYDEIPEDEVGHGTHVAGIIAGKGINMPVGVVPKCRILPVRVLGAMQRGGKKVGAGLVDNINAGIKWAIDRGANVINMSLGIEHTGGGLPHQEVVDYAKLRNVTIVAASGNDGREKLYYPGALPHVIAVGAADETRRVASFSTYGKQVDLIAPGTDIYSTHINNEYAFSTGTSHASPFVAGAIALLKSYALEKGVKLVDHQVKYLLKHSSDKIDSRFKHKKAGFGQLNLQDALRLLDYKLS
ncbi:MAG: S8 family serine peptidase [Cyanobacteria bacterium J06635_10]